MDHASGPQAVPPFIETLGEKILSGDGDAISLMATPENFLLRPGSDGKREPPTAIKAQYYRYQFSNWTELQKGQWWVRRPIVNSPPVLILPKEDTSEGQIRRVSPYRSWTLGGLVFGFTVSLIASIESSSLLSASVYSLITLSFLTSFCIMLSIEYSMDECMLVPGGGITKTLTKRLLRPPFVNESTMNDAFTRLHELVLKGLLSVLITVFGLLFSTFKRPPLLLDAIVVCCACVFMLSMSPWPVPGVM